MGSAHSSMSLRFAFTAAALMFTLGFAEAQSMPGTPVGTPIVVPVGQQIPKAVPPAGNRVGAAPNGQAAPNLNSTLNMTTPPGQVVDMNNVATPYPGMPKKNSYLTSLSNAWFSLFQSNAPAKTSNWTPGIARRNHQHTEKRIDEMRLRD